MTLMQTCLYSRHIAAGGKMVDFSGWQMPIHYGSQINEHTAVRERAGVFDVSHMTVIDVIGQDARAYLQHLLANDVDRLATLGQALYSAMLNHEGGVVDDLIVYRGPEGYRLVVNCGTREKDLAWLQQAAEGFAVEMMEQAELAMLAVQGPQALSVLNQVLPTDVAQRFKQLKPFECLFEDDLVVARTGYTGEKGAEVMLQKDAACALWDRLLEEGVMPIGLGARDTLRLEAGLNLYGSDMNESVKPSSCNLSWTVVHNGRNFIGEQALINRVPTETEHKMIGVILKERGVLRSGYPILCDGNQVGVVTSGAFSPTLQSGIGFARVSVEETSLTQLSAEIRGKLVPVTAVSLPFVKQGKAVYQLLVD